MSNREAIWGVSEHHANQVLNTVVGLGVYKATNWFRNNYKNIKTGLDTYYAIKPKTQMARFRRTGFKRRRLSRRYGKKRRFYRSKRGLAGRVRRISRMLRSKGVRNTEIKYNDTYNATYMDPPSVSGPIPTVLTSIARGTTQNDRIGAKVFIRKIRFQAVITAGAAPTYPEQYGLIYIVRDKQPASETVAPTYYDMFKFPIALPPSGQAQGNLAMMTMRHIGNRMQNRFQVLAKWRFKVVAESGAGAKTVYINKTIPVFKPCYYGTASDLSTRGPGQIYAYYISSDPSTTSANQIQIQTVQRVSFTDI